MANTTKTYTTFIAHGYRNVEANEFLRDLILEIAGGRSEINLGFLEFASPHASDAIRIHLHHGATRIHIIPLFIAPGRHVTEDIPKILADAKEQNPDVEFILKDFIGNHPDYKRLLRQLVAD